MPEFKSRNSRCCRDTNNKKWLNLRGPVIFVDNTSILVPAGESTAVYGAIVRVQTWSNIVLLLLHIRNPLVSGISDICISENFSIMNSKVINILVTLSLHISLAPLLP